MWKFTSPFSNFALATYRPEIVACSGRHGHHRVAARKFVLAPSSNWCTLSGADTSRACGVVRLATRRRVIETKAWST
jgi:hypothetical protein